ncbi:MAG: GNAT family N-acetyltransferase [Alphaproteobacteria bacterium]|jgi:GNAT superfamily N-acetyltransferase|nr:GNAT family N-acetyltransferase [Alphaproteobacteria bacterium]
MGQTDKTSDPKVRRLAPDDLDPAVAIDRKIVGHSRRGYFEKRLAAALRDPDGHIQFAIDGEGGLEAAVLARVQSGEFGREAPAVMLEVIDVAPEQQHLGHGAALLGALEDEMRRRGIDELQTSIAWTDHVMAKFFAANGFAKAPRHIIAVTVDPSREAAALSDDGDDDEDQDDADDIDRADNFRALPRDRVDVASLSEQDLDALVLIDGKLTGRDRRDYMAAKLNEALVDSGIRISLAARRDGFVAGFVMARLDFGDFGRTDAVAVVDTIGVHPEFAGHGIAHALLSQLLVNLNGLRVESAETTIALDDFELLGFLYRSGFQPTQRIALVKQVG